MDPKQDVASPSSTKQRCLDPSDPDFDFDYVFGTGQVLVENRLTSHDVSTVKEVKPVTYASDLRSKLASVSGTMSATEQRDYLQDQVARKSEYHTLIASINESAGNLIDALVSMTRSSTNKTFTIGKATHYYPRIPSERHDVFLDAIAHYIDRLYSTIDATYRLEGVALDIPASRRNIESKISITHNISAKEKKCLTAIQHAATLEWIRDTREATAVALLRSKRLLEQHASDRAFITSKPTPAAPQIESLIPSDATNISMAPIYNFSVTQTHHLIHAMFNRNTRARLHARIQLLSTTRNDIRSDIVVNPAAVLRRVFAEHYCSRYEILCLVFENQDKSLPPDTYKCPWCVQHVVLTDTKLTHAQCPVTKWLAETFQFITTSDSLQIPSGFLLDCSTSKYAKTLLSLDAQHRLRPIVSRTADELAVWTVTDAGDPKKMLSHGIRTVKYADSSGSKK